MYRVTPFSIANNTIFYNRTHLAALATLQRQLASGLKYQRPSDNPLATAQIRSQYAVVSGLDLQKTQIDEANLQLNQSVSNLLDAENLLNRAHEIALDAPQETEPAARQALVTEVDSIIDRLKSIINSRSGSLYLYSGTATTTKPLGETSRPELSVPLFNYQASRVRQSISLSDSVSVDIRYTAQEVFFGKTDRQATLYFGDTGAAAGAGTDSGIGRAVLSVYHTSTTFAPGSGITAGDDSPSGDTIIGPAGANVLTINDTSGTGAFGTVSLNGGTAVNFTNGDTNLQVTGPRGEVVFLNTTSITAGFTGDVDVTANGELSTDDGLTRTAIDFSNNQILTNSISGQVTHVDSSGIWQTGVNHLEYVGTADDLTALYELRDDLLNSRGLDTQTLADSYQRRAVDLQRGVDRLLKIVGEQSSALENLDQLGNRNSELKLQVQESIVNLESVDLTQVVSDLESRQSLLQFSFAAYNIVQNTNILKFLG